jgi:hypothetical protein
VPPKYRAPEDMNAWKTNAISATDTPTAAATTCHAVPRYDRLASACANGPKPTSTDGTSAIVSNTSGTSTCASAPP